MSVLCSNKGCRQRFDPESNPEDACTYHPGVPVFHDALKVIDISKSVVNMMVPKVEVVMKKAEPMAWARLDLPPPKPQPTNEKTENHDERKC